MEYYSKKIDSTLKDVKSSTDGLTEQEAALRLEQNGKNELKDKKKTPAILKFLMQFKDVMIILLFVSATISICFSFINHSRSELIDAIIIFAIIILNATLGFMQEMKAENAMESLKKMSSPYTKVIRAGKEIFVKTSDLVVGDLVLLEAGDIAPADLRLIETASLKCDESALTGESNAIEKDASLVLKSNTALADRKNMAYSSSVVVYGRGMGVVVATAQNREIGKIATMLNDQKKETTTLERSLNKLGKIITIIVLAIAVLIFFVDMFVTRLSWTESLMTAVAIAVAAIPESLMVVVTIILSLSVTKLAKKNIIIRRLQAVETLGCCEIICSDKTGTITQNKMTVKSVFVNNQFIELDDKLDSLAKSHLLNAMVLCNDTKVQEGELIGDPTETALVDYAHKLGLAKPNLDKAFKRVNEIPFDSQRKLMSTLNNFNGKLIQHTKGGIDELLAKCSYIIENDKKRKITKDDLSALKQANESMCAKALRVLAFAVKECATAAEFGENDLTFVGLVGMIDPPREEVYEALKKCKKAGMQAIMITGDHKNTAYAIAKELEIVSSISEVTDGAYLDQFTDEQLKTEIWKFKVFTRVSPEHKVRIVNAFKSNGKVVAMTGDGVNDAPSIKAANIGIGMGKTGTEVTKDVADMILTDDNFATIIVAVEEGRKIYSNIQKTVQFLVGCNIAEVLAIFVLTLLFPNIPFLVAVQILFINLITDSLPAIALGMETVERDVMSHKPRSAKENIMGGQVGFNIFYQGLTQAIVVIFLFVMGTHLFGGTVAATMGFLCLNLIQLVQMYLVRTNHSIFKSNPFKNKLMNLSFVVGVGLLLFIMLVPHVNSVFHIANLTLNQWLISIGFALIPIPVTEIVKLVQHSANKSQNTK